MITLRTLFLILFGCLAYSSSAYAGTVICIDPSNPRNWTIALGGSVAQARANAASITGDDCRRPQECDGGWYAFIGGEGDGQAAVCGLSSKAAAITEAKKRCRAQGDSSCGSFCIIGFDDKQPQQARSGTVWMGNKFTERSCP